MKKFRVRRRQPLAAAIIFNITAIILSVILERGVLVISPREFIALTGGVFCFDLLMVLWAVWPSRPSKLPPGHLPMRPPPPPGGGKRR